MMIFKDAYGKIVTLQEIVNLVENDHEYDVFVGSDSQVFKKKKCVTYVTCIVLYKRGKGGRIFMSRDYEKYANSLKERLAKEVFRSLQVAFELKEILPFNVELTIHIDVNPKKKFKSGEYAQEFISMIVGQGFKCVIKPDAFAAQNCANKSTK